MCPCGLPVKRLPLSAPDKKENVWVLNCLGLLRGSRSPQEKEVYPFSVYSTGPWQTPFIPSSLDLCLGLRTHRLKLDL